MTYMPMWKMMGSHWIPINDIYYGPGHEGEPVLLPGFAIQVRRQVHFRDQTNIKQSYGY